MRLIDADMLFEVIKQNDYPLSTRHNSIDNGMFTLGIKQAIDEAQTIDAVPMVHLEKWLYEIAINNADNYLSDACEEIISRLDGLKRFSKETKMDKVSDD